jgi:hypothetical protein
MQMKLLGIIIVGVDATGEVLIIYSFIKYFRKTGNTMKQRKFL